MTIAQMAQLFDLIQDKYGSPYYTDAEKSLFLNRAAVDFVNSKLATIVADDNIEFTQDSVSSVATLIKYVNTLKMDSTGAITKANINTQLNPSILWRPLAIGLKLGNTTKPVKFVRHNDWFKFKDNYFKNPTVDNPKYRESVDKFIFEPISTSATIYITALVYPKVMDIGTAVDCDLPDFTHNDIIALALEYAGIGSRDENLAQLLQLKTK